MPLCVPVFLGIGIVMLTKQVFEARNDLGRGKGHIPFIVKSVMRLSSRIEKPSRGFSAG